MALSSVNLSDTSAVAQTLMQLDSTYQYDREKEVSKKLKLYNNNNNVQNQSQLNYQPNSFNHHNVSHNNINAIQVGNNTRDRFRHRNKKNYRPWNEQSCHGHQYIQSHPNPVIYH
ncbi:putative uncharacterized protein DDB_G0288037 [Chelonus insularis]|uniref:putative uncharacterized protein DDB_G0288037 n=1 Tax=Chelonus insularis TaxID=460826 RepID=UPI00158D204B|nr:putative uncharacterized protein DDB_G0288037 [Chelonus insularis]